MHSAKVGDKVRTTAEGTAVLKREIRGVVTHVDALDKTAVKVRENGAPPSVKLGRTVSIRYLEPDNG